MVDGGLEYTRQIVQPTAPPVDLCVYLEDGIETVREALTWGTYGRNGDQPRREVRLMDMTNEHIQACLDTQLRMHPHYREAFEMELEYREEHGIVVTDV